jgi:hypothetical protein
LIEENAMSKMIQRKDGSWLTGDEILPKLQHKIILCLAKNKAMTMSETNRKLETNKKTKMGTNTSTTRAFHELKKKEMITEVGAIEYHGRKFVEYWLSGRGIAYVLMHRAELTKSASEYLKDKTIETYLKLRSASDRIANLLDYSMFRFGNLSFQEMVSYFVLTVNFYGEREALEFLDVTKLPEEFYVELRNNLETIKKFLIMMEKIREK